MAFRLVVSDTVSAPVSGSLPDDCGNFVPFSFTLICKRLTASELRARNQRIQDGDLLIDEFLRDVVRGWSGVQDSAGGELTFSVPALVALTDIAGMSGLILSAYAQACGARGKEKN